MRLSLLNILSEEIKEQGFGRYFQSAKSVSGRRAGDEYGYDFEKGEPISKDLKTKTEVGSFNLEDSDEFDNINSFIIKPSSKRGSKFGMRNGKMHKGGDYPITPGTNVLLLIPGKVTLADMNADPNGYGALIKIDHGGGLETRYGHMSQIDVSEGDDVKPGQIIGKTGGASGAVGSGNSGGPHLHFEYRPSGNAIDPSTDDNDNKVFRFVKDSDLSNLSFSKKEEKDEEDDDESEVNVDKNKNYIIGDSQVPYIDNASEKAKRIKETGSKKSLWLGGKGVSWLKGAVDEYPISKDVNSIIISIGTNGGFNTGENISGLVKSLKGKFPNAKLYAVKGSWGWGGNKKIKESEVNSYYDIFSNNGVTIIKTPIGKVTDPHGDLPIYKTIGKEIDEKL